MSDFTGIGAVMRSTIQTACGIVALVVTLVTNGCAGETDLSASASESLTERSTPAAVSAPEGTFVEAVSVDTPTLVTVTPEMQAARLEAIRRGFQAATDPERWARELLDRPEVSVVLATLRSTTVTAGEQMLRFDVDESLARYDGDASLTLRQPQLGRTGREIRAAAGSRFVLFLSRDGDAWRLAFRPQLCAWMSEEERSTETFRFCQGRPFRLAQLRVLAAAL